MKRSVQPLLILLAIALAGCTATPDSALLDPRVACAGVETGHGQSAGRGFFVSADGLLVTSEQAVHGGELVTVTTNDGRALIGKVVQKDRENDLAIVKVPGSAFPALRLHPVDAEPGLHIRVVSGAGVKLGTFKEWESFGHEMGIAVDVSPADAGAPVLADNGVVVGIVHSSRDNPHTAIPAWRVLQMMPMLGSTSPRGK